MVVETAHADRQPFCNREFNPMKLLRAILFAMTSVAVAHASTVTKAPFGKLADGTAVDAYTLKTPEVEARIATYGARIVAIQTKDRNGKFADIILGHSSVEPYTQGKNAYFG